MSQELNVKKGKWKVLMLFTFLFFLLPAAEGQKLIEYSAGMGSRDPDDGNIWILFNGVTARHEGMTLRSDSAHYNTKENSFTAFGAIVIRLSDTTFIYGDRLFYDGNTRIVDIWDDTVLLVDGRTQLRADHITYIRNTETAFYPHWGHAVSGLRKLDSQQGLYNASRKEFYIYDSVQLSDDEMQLFTDTLIYNTVTEVAHFKSPTRIYTDSAFIYSELGDYNTASREATSFLASHVNNKGRTIDCDTLYYHDSLRYGKAQGNVRIFDSVNNLTCTGRYGESNQASGFSFVTDSALVVFVDDGDSLFLHADSVYLTTDSANHIQTVRANYKVKVYRRDAQAMCDVVREAFLDPMTSDVMTGWVDCESDDDFDACMLLASPADKDFTPEFINEIYNK